MKKFTREETKLFLDLYEQEECLWRLDLDKVQKSDKKKKEARKRIVEAMSLQEFDELSVSKKFIALRQTYNQEITKVAKSKKFSGSNQYVSNIPWLGQMRNILSRYKQTEFLDTDFAKSKQSNDEYQDIENYSTSSIVVKSEPEDDDIYVGEYDYEKDQEINNPNKRRKKEIDEISQSNTMISFEDKTVSHLGTSSENELDLFVKYIKAEMQTLKPKTRLKLQKDIINLVLDSKIKDID